MFSKDSSKTKTKAVVMALFFGFAGWFYTYKRDAKKFWFACVLSICLFVVAFFTASSIIKTLLELLSLENLLNYDHSDLLQIIKDKWLALLGISLGGLSLWLWPIIDAFRRPDSWYEDYSKEIRSD